MKLLSTLTADRYGPPLSDIPESEDNHNVEQMIESIVNMVPVEKNDPKSFIHLKVRLNFSTIHRKRNKTSTENYFCIFLESGFRPPYERGRYYGIYV